jgi:hypothetical protein
MVIAVSWVVAPCGLVKVHRTEASEVLSASIIKEMITKLNIRKPTSYYELDLEYWHCMSAAQTK